MLGLGVSSKEKSYFHVIHQSSMSKVGSYKLLALILCLVNIGLAVSVYVLGFSGPLVVRIFKVLAFSITSITGLACLAAVVVRILPERIIRPHMFQPEIEGDRRGGSSVAIVFWIVLVVLALALCFLRN